MEIYFKPLSVCTYVVEETDQVIITQFGKPVGEPVIEAGLFQNSFHPGGQSD